MKLLFVNQHMKMGGIAGSLYNALKLLNNETDWQIELLIFDPFFDEKFIDLNQIKIHTPFWLKFLYINHNEALKKLPFFQYLLFLPVKSLAKIIGIKKSRLFLIKKSRFKTAYDVAISYSNDIPADDVLVGTNDFVLHAVKAKQKIAWIHNDLIKLGFTPDYTRQRYQSFDKVVNVSKSCQEQFETLAPEYKSKSYRVINYIDRDTILNKAGAFEAYPGRNDEIILVTVARIDNRQKRIDRILEITKKLQKDRLNFKWYVIGDGPDLNHLKQLAEKQQLYNVIFKGYQKNPYPYIKQADLFVLTSDYEAQGIVLVEALMLSTPVVTTDFPAAWDNVLNHKNGLIIPPDINQLHQQISDLIKHKEKLNILKTNAGYQPDLKSIYLKEFKRLLQI